jgi:hypothetical protein
VLCCPLVVLDCLCHVIRSDSFFVLSDIYANNFWDKESLPSNYMYQKTFFEKKYMLTQHKHAALKVIESNKIIVFDYKWSKCFLFGILWLKETRLLLLL